MSNYCKNCYELQEQLDQLKAENDELKESVSELITMKEEDIKRINNAIKLKQTLTEIKEIAEKAKKDICNNCGWRNTDSCDPEDYTCGEFIKILQKISECEVE